MRGTRLSVRHAMTSPSAAGAGRLFTTSSSERELLRRMAGERQEDVVEGRSAKGDVVDPDTGVAERAHDVDELLRSAVGRDGEPLRPLVARRRAVRGEHVRGLREPGAIVDDHLDPLAADPGLELVRGPARDDPTLVDDRDLVRELVGLLEVLRRQEQRVPFAHLGADHVPQPEPASRVEPGGRLVEEQQLGSTDERPGEVEAPSHAARVGLRDPVTGALQAELLEQLVRAAPCLGARELVQASEHPEVLAAREVLVDRGVLTGEPDQPPHLVRLSANVEPADARRAGVGVEQRREDPHRRRLARAVRAEQSEDGSLAHLEIDAVERAHLGLARPVDLDEPLCLDRCQVGKPTPPLRGPHGAADRTPPRGALADD